MAKKLKIGDVIRGYRVTKVFGPGAMAISYAAESRDGRYFGKYQFSQPTWEAMGGTGSPAEADEATQDQLAYKLYQQRGTAPWPTCGAKLDEAD